MKCRVLDLPAQGALFNTALDQFLLEGASKGQFTLAFTKWKPSVLIGNSQSLVLDVDREVCEKKGISIMRRFSGGQAVYLDENYIVFTVVGPRNHFPDSLTKLRQQLCKACIRALRKFRVPTDFFAPDNLVIFSPGRVGSSPSIARTLGNSGQIIKRDAVAVSASIRYDLRDGGLETMLAVLKTNGKSLCEFFEPAKESLAWVREFTSAPVGAIKKALVEEIAIDHGCDGYYQDELTQYESGRIAELKAELVSEMRLKDKSIYKSRGVCYFYLGGRCIVPEIANFLPSVKPSTHLDSTIS